MGGILVLPGSGPAHRQCPRLTPSYQGIPLYFCLANGLQGMIDAWSCHFVTCPFSVPFFSYLTQISYLQLEGVVRDPGRKLEELAVWCGIVGKHQVESRPEFESAINFLWSWTIYSTSRGSTCCFYKMRVRPDHFCGPLLSNPCRLPLPVTRFWGLKTDIFLGEALSASCRHPLPAVIILMRSWVSFP